MVCRKYMEKRYYMTSCDFYFERYGNYWFQSKNKMASKKTKRRPKWPPNEPHGTIFRNGNIKIRILETLRVTKIWVKKIIFRVVGDPPSSPTKGGYRYFRRVKAFKQLCLKTAKDVLVCLCLDPFILNDVILYVHNGLKHVVNINFASCTRKVEIIAKNNIITV